MRRTMTPALLLASALAFDVRSACGQLADAGPRTPHEVADGDAPPPDTSSPASAPAMTSGRSRSGSEERRDPFVSSFWRNRPAPQTVRPRGLAGIDIDQLTLRGLVRFAGAYVAVMESAEGRSYLLRGGEALYDGSVRSVTAAGVLIVRHDSGATTGATERSVRLTLGTATEEEAR